MIILMHFHRDSQIYTLYELYVIFCDIRVPFRNDKMAMTPHCVKRPTLLFFKLQVKYH